MGIKDSIKKIAKVISDQFPEDFSVGNPKKQGYKKLNDFDDPEKTYFYIKKTPSFLPDGLALFDKEGNLKCSSRKSSKFFASSIDSDIFDKNNNKVGYVKDHERKAGGVFEWDIRKCSAYRGKELISKVKFFREKSSSNIFLKTGNGLDASLETISGDWSLSFVDEKKRTIKIKKGGRIISIVYDIAAEPEDSDYVYYVLEYRGKSLDDEINSFIMTIAINTLRSIRF